MVSLPADGSVVWLLLCALAAWRVTAAICYDAGPFDIFTRLRRVAAAAGLLRLVTCFHCTAVWSSAAIVVVVFQRRWLTFLVFLGVAGAVSIMERWLGGVAARPVNGEGLDG